MKRNIIHLFCDFDCVVNVDNATLELQKNSPYPQVLYVGEADAIKVYPKISNSMSFQFSLVSLPKNTQTISYPNGVVEIRLAEILVETSSDHVLLDKSFQHENNIISIKVVSIKNSIIILTSNGKEIRLKTNKHLHDCKAEILSMDIVSFLKLEGKNEKNQYEMFFILLPLTKNFYTFTCDEYKIDKNQIVFQTSLNDMFGHKKIKIVKPNKNNVEVVENFIALPKNCPLPSINDANVGMAFFEALKAKNFTLAKSFLSQKLQGVFTKSTTQKFFGKFDEIKEIPGIKNGYCLIAEKKTNFFQIKVSSATITDIETLDTTH